MSWALIIYLISVLSSLKVVAIISTAIVAVVGFLILAYYALEESRLWPHWKAWAAAGMVLAILASIIPSKEVMYSMVGADVAQSVVQSEKAKELGELSLDIIKQQLNNLKEK